MFLLVFHVKRGCVTCWGWEGVFMGSWVVLFFLVLWWCGGFTWNMGNACKGNLLRLQSCFLVFESFSMFHVKHDVFTTTHVFHVKRRVGWLSCGWWFLRTLSLVGVEEVVFHVKHWFWILFSCWEMRFSVSRHWHAWLLFRSKEAYSATGKIHLRQQTENQKEHVI